MNRLITGIGVVLLAVGLVVAIVPLFNGPSDVLTPAHPELAFNATTSFSITGTWTIGVSWSSNQAVSLLVVVCRSINVSAVSDQTTCPGASLTVLNGTSGSPSFAVPLGGTILIGVVSKTMPGLRVDVQLRPTLAFLGTILVFGGVGVTIVGLIPRRKPPAPKSASDPEPPSG